MIRQWINRYKALKHVTLADEHSYFFPHKNVQFFLEDKSQIIIENGALRMGYHLPKVRSRPIYDKSVVVLGEGAIFSVSGDVFIAPGFYIHVYPGGKLFFHGHNWVAHNCTIICGKYMEFGLNASLSWNVTMIDDDGRSFYTADGEPIKKGYRPLILGDDVGIQMNVVIPRGVKIGKKSVVGANTVVRQDVPESCLAYQNPELKIKNDTTTGLQNIR